MIGHGLIRAVCRAAIAGTDVKLGMEFPALCWYCNLWCCDGGGCKSKIPV